MLRLSASADSAGVVARGKWIVGDPASVAVIRKRSPSRGVTMVNRPRLGDGLADLGLDICTPGRLEGEVAITTSPSIPARKGRNRSRARKSFWRLRGGHARA